MDVGVYRARQAGDVEHVLAAFDAMPVIMAALEGPQHRIVAANRQYRALLGRPNWLGRPAREVFPDIAGQQIFALLDQVLASGEAVYAREWRIQFARGDDAEPTEWYFDFTLTPWLTDDGGVRGVLVNQTDVTARVQQRLREERRTAEAEERYRTAHALVARLQEALLPRELPVLPRLDVSAAYVVAGREQAAGGDWFDAVVLPDGTVALAVGDVVGHGVLAAAAMAEARAVLNELLTETGDLALARRRVDRLARRKPGLRAATLCVAVVDTRSGDLRYSTCGHPPPLVVAPDGGTRYLPTTGNGPLGTGSAAVLASTTLGKGDVLMLNSDGLVERPGGTLADGLEVLARVAADAVANRVMPLGAPQATAERVCVQSVEIITRNGYDDDVTALAVHLRATPVEPLHLTLPATTASAPQARDAVRRWLARLGVGQDEAGMVELAVAELVANAIEHAYPSGTSGRIGVTAELDDHGVLTICVSDDGAWHEPPSAPTSTSGRGLWIVGEIVDELHLEHPGPLSRDSSLPGAGTVARMRHRLRHGARVGMPERAGSPASQLETGGYADRVEEGPPRRLCAQGAIDVATAPTFAHALNVASRGGVNPVVVDVTGVHLLTSAGVSVLLAARDQHVTHGHGLTVLAARGSGAAQVLDLVGIEHELR